MSNAMTMCSGAMLAELGCTRESIRFVAACRDVEEAWSSFEDAPVLAYFLAKLGFSVHRVLSVMPIADTGRNQHQLKHYALYKSPAAVYAVAKRFAEYLDIPPSAVAAALREEFSLLEVLEAVQRRLA